MRLGALDNDTVLPLVHDVKIQVGIGLFVGRKASVPLGVCHGTVTGKIVFLDIFEILQKALVVLAAALLVDIVGHDGERIQRIHAHTPLKTTARFPAQQSAHFAFFDQVANALVDMGKAIDAFAGEMRCGGHQVFVFRHMRQFIGLGNRLHGRPYDRIVHYIGQTFTKHVDNQIQLAQTLLILCCSHHCHGLSLFYKTPYCGTFYALGGVSQIVNVHGIFMLFLQDY